VEQGYPYARPVPCACQLRNDQRACQNYYRCCCPALEVKIGGGSMIALFRASKSNDERLASAVLMLANDTLPLWQIKA
jgi:hypothetical protein